MRLIGEVPTQGAPIELIDKARQRTAYSKSNPDRKGRFLKFEAVTTESHPDVSIAQQEDGEGRKLPLWHIGFAQEGKEPECVVRIGQVGGASVCRLVEDNR
jgi:hypothetical protein